MERHPETISPRNRGFIEAGIRNKQRIGADYKGGPSPEVDDTWLKHFPEHAGQKYYRKKLLHHHVNQGRYCIPVPAPSHQGRYGPWHYTDQTPEFFENL
jgi:hypothetical protein